MKRYAGLLFALAALGAQGAPVHDGQPQVVALLAAIGDRIEVVSPSVPYGGHFDAYNRRVLQVPSQALNYGVLRGLDAAVAEDAPQDERVLVQWTMPDELAARMENAHGQDRQALVLQAVTAYLQALPQRQAWDRIEMVVPDFSYRSVHELGPGLSGIGVYIQPDTSGGMGDAVYMSSPMELGMFVLNGAGASYETVNPVSGETGRSSSFIAPYMYCERLTFDAKTLALVKRQRLLSSTKYADPMSPSLEVAEQMSPVQLMGKLMQTVERTAFKTIRPASSDIKVSPIKPVTEPVSEPGRASDAGIR